MTKERILTLLKTLQQDEDLLTVSNESRDGRLFATIFFYEARYVVERGCWYTFNGTHWEPDKGSLRVMEMCKKLAYAMVQFANESGNVTLLNKAIKWHKRHHREIVLRDAASVNPLSISEFDDNPYYFNMKNGTINLKDGIIHPHDPLDLITRCADFEYHEGLHCDRFDAFIDEITSGDRERGVYLQKALGYSLCGVNSEECLFILYGATTRNGKSTLMESVVSVMGSYACTSNPETVAQKPLNSGAPSEDVARLKGVRLVNISEPPQSLVFNAARVKTMTGSDTLNARFLHENSFDFKPEFKLYINTNHLPVVNDQTLFTSGRLHIIPFERHFAPNEQDKHLKEEFAQKDVKNYIGMWLIEGYFHYLGTDLAPPESVKNATDEYAAASDKIKQFIDERLTPAVGEATPTSVVYKEYRNWCIGNGMQPLAQNRFSEKLKRYGEIKFKKISGSSFRCVIGYKVTEVTNHYSNSL